MVNRLRWQKFQSTPPRGRRHNNLVHDTFCNEFQSTPPRGRRHLYIFISPSNQYFKPLRREGGDNKNVIVLKDATISIHSAARAETQAPWGNQAHGEFQSTPPRGRRRIGGTSHTKRVDFNPLRREGGDVSPPTLCNNDAEFQSTPPRGRRPSSPRQLENFWTFQSTPPRGRRPLAACFSAGPICDFNPLRREGGDVHGPQQRMITQYISIHSAARAETVSVAGR